MIGDSFSFVWYNYCLDSNILFIHCSQKTVPHVQGKSFVLNSTSVPQRCKWNQFLYRTCVHIHTHPKIHCTGCPRKKWNPILQFNLLERSSTVFNLQAAHRELVLCVLLLILSMRSLKRSIVGKPVQLYGSIQIPQSIYTGKHRRS